MRDKPDNVADSRATMPDQVRVEKCFDRGGTLIPCPGDMDIENVLMCHL